MSEFTQYSQAHPSVVVDRGDPLDRDDLAELNNDHFLPRMHPVMSRLAFMKASATGTVALVLAACGATPPTGGALPATGAPKTNGEVARSPNSLSVHDGPSVVELASIPSGDGVVATRRAIGDSLGYELSPPAAQGGIEAYMNELPWLSEVDTSGELHPIYFKNGAKELPWLASIGTGAFVMAVGMSQYQRILENHVDKGQAEDVARCANGEKKTIDHNWNLALYVMAVATGIAGVSKLDAQVVKVLSERMNGLDYPADILMIRVNAASLAQELTRRGMTMVDLGISELPKIGSDIYMRVILPAKQVIDPVKGPQPTAHWVSIPETLQEIMSRERDVIDRVKDPLGYFARVAVLAKLVKKYIRDHAKTWCNPFFRRPNDISKMMVIELPGAIDVDQPQASGLSEQLLGATPTPIPDGFRTFLIIDSVEGISNFILVPR